jgi:uncharacterized protein involved in exopolysaccharide biosynthesis
VADDSAARRSTPRDVLTILFKRKTRIILFFCTVVGSITIATFSINPIYEASAKVLVKNGGMNIYMPTDGNVHFAGFDRKNQINTEIELLKGQAITRKVIDQLGPELVINENIDSAPLFFTHLRHNSQTKTAMEKAVIHFRKNLFVDEVEHSNVIMIRFRHKNAVTAAKIVNTLVATYLDEHLLLHNNYQAPLLLNGEPQDLKDSLKKAENELASFKKKHNIILLPEQQKLLLQQIADIQVDLNRTLSNEEETKNRIIQLASQLKQTPEKLAYEPNTDHNSYITSRLETTLLELQLEEEELLSKYTRHNPFVQNVQKKINIVKSKLADRKTGFHQTRKAVRNATYQRLQEEILKNTANIKAIQAKKNLLSRQLRTHQTTLAEFNRLEVRFNQLQQAINLNRQNYRRYLAQFEEFRIAGAMDAKQVNAVVLMEKALPPFKPVIPKILLNLVVAVSAGLLGGIGLALISEYVDDRLDNAETAAKVLQLPVLVSVPEMTSAGGADGSWRRPL